MSTLKIEHIANIANSGPDISIDTSGHLNIVNGSLQMGGTTMLDTSDTTLKNVSKIGIGTASPQQLLHVNGGAADTTIQITNSVSGSAATDGFMLTVENPSGDVNIRNREATNMRFYTSNDERMRIDSTGDINFRSSASSLINLNFTDSVLNDYARIEGGKSGSGVGDLRFHVYSGGLSESMRIDSSGNVGIGTTSPSSTLQITPPNDHQNSFRIYRGGTSGYQLNYMNMSLYGGNVISNVVSSDTSGKRFIWQVNGTEAARIEQDGSLNLLKTRAGTISSGTSNTGAVIKLHTEAQWESGYGNTIDSTSNDYLGSIEFSSGDSSTGEGVRAAIRGTVDSYYNTNSIVFETANSATAEAPIERMKILYNGNVGIGSSIPDGKLTVALENSNTPAFRLSSPTSSNDFAISSYNDSNGTYVALGVNYLFDVSGNDAIMDTSKRSAGIVLDGRNNGRIQFVTANSGIPATRMTITKDGEVGIGTTSPDSKLHVFNGEASITADADADDLIVENNGAAGITIGSSASSVGSIRFADSSQPRAGMLYYSHITNDMRIYTNQAQALSIIDDQLSIHYNGTAGGHNSKLLFKDKRGAANVGIYNNLQDDGVGSAAAHMEFHTSNGGTLTKQMTIDRFGQVMMPNQPSFRAYSTSDFTANGALEGSNWAEQHDNNNDFYQGRFTAPVDGVYLFTVYWDSNNSKAGLNLLVNGGTYYVKWEPTGVLGDAWESRGYSTTIKLSSGDYVRLYGAHASGSNPFHMGGGHWGFFSGHLLG